jgi:4-alpha-glucanotransferase
MDRRKSGVLLHPTSLPGKHGIGDLGKEAYQFIDFMKEAGLTLWQVLPLGPTGYGDSPYASFSTHGGNPLIISPQLLMEQGYLEEKDFGDEPSFDKNSVDFGSLIPWKKELLNKAAQNFLKKNPHDKAFLIFCREESHWLDDFSLFMSVKEHFDQKAFSSGVHGAMWSNYWDRDIALKESGAVKAWSQKLHVEIQKHKILQYFFFRQWLGVREYANKKGIQIIGDIPIFVAPDSVDVWANRELFLLNSDGAPSSVAGVPPDYFSETGQLWGNPLYNWKVMEKRHFKWWIERIKGTLKLVDIIRVDHFRGFEAFWQVPGGNKNAVEGQWVKAPGKKLFKQVKKSLGILPILAEDLGVITDEVNELRDHFNFPGMRILQFAFDMAEGESGLDADNLFLPHNYVRNSVVYTGTHDNSTMKGWLDTCKKEEMEYIHDYFGYKDKNPVWMFIRMALSSTSAYCIIPLQDFLELDDKARMNIPSTLGGNWSWRFSEKMITGKLKEKILKLNRLYGRVEK